MNLPSNPRIAVIGTGAVGGYYGARLAQAGQDIHFLLRSDFAHVAEHGLTIRSIDGDLHLPRPAIHSSTASIGPCDVVLIAMKSTVNDALLDLLPPLLKPGTLLVTLQNGLGNEDFLAHHFSAHADSILGGLCFVCINRVAPGVIHHIAQGLITLGEHAGPALPRTHQLAAALAAAGIPCSVDGSLARSRWKKLVWNIPFNGLSIAAGGLDTAAILADPALAELVRELMQEIIATAQHLGHDLPATLADDMIARTRTMTQYKPSSLIDFLAGHEVEIDAIWAEPCRRARAAGHPMLRVETLLQLLRSRLHQRELSVR